MMLFWATKGSEGYCSTDRLHRKNFIDMEFLNFAIIIFQYISIPFIFTKSTEYVLEDDNDKFRNSIPAVF